MSYAARRIGFLELFNAASTIQKMMISFDRPLMKRGAAGAGIAVIVNVVLLQIVLQSGIVEPFRPVSMAPIVLLTIFGVAGATVAFAVIRERADAPVHRFYQIAIGVLVLSFIPDLILLRFDPSATLSGAVFLMILHVTTALFAVGALTGFINRYPLS